MGMTALIGVSEGSEPELLRVRTRDIEPGMTLAQPVRDPARRDRVLLKRGYLLEPEVISRIRQLEVQQVWVDYPSLERLSTFVNPELNDAQASLVTCVSSAMRSMQQDSVATLPYHEYCKAIGTLINQCVSNPQAAMFTGDLADGNDELLTRGANVAYLSVLMGLKLEGYLVRQRRHIPPHRAKQVRNLGLGALLHDVGICLLDDAVIKRMQQTGDESDPEWQEHPWLGFSRVRGDVEPTAAAVVLHHHQRYDGSGYAGQRQAPLEGDKIHIYARIASMAVWFEEQRHPPFGRGEPRATVEVQRDLVFSDAVNQFDPYVIRVLFDVAPPYPPGAMVRLRDQRWAVVIDVDPTDPCRPTVQITPPPAELLHGIVSEVTPEIVDLAVHTNVEIVEIDGHDVRGMNFDPPGVLEYARSYAWF